MSMDFYSYYRSSASYRVRIALYLKKIDFNYIPVHLTKDGGEQYSAAYRMRNPMSQVPCLMVNGWPLTQSMAILQYLDDVYPHPKLFPQDPLLKGKVLQICEVINSGIQPLQNLSTTRELKSRFGGSDEAIQGWLKHFIGNGMTALEQILEKTAGTYCVGGELTAADLFLVPQVFSAERFGVELTPFATIQRLAANCRKLAAFQRADPSCQPDSPKQN